MSPNVPTFEFPSLPTKLLMKLGIAVTLFVVLLSLYGYANSLQKQAVEREVRLSRSYESLKSELDTFLTKAREQAGVTKAQSAAFDKIMLDAVAGRYQGQDGAPTSAQPTGGSMFSAIAEAYPNLDTLNSSYTRILDTISEGRAAFNNGQYKLQDQLREYDVWRKSGLVRSFMLDVIGGVPTDNLTVVTDQKYTRQAAYDKMSKVITSGLTAESFKTGELNAQNFFE